MRRLTTAVVALVAATALGGCARKPKESYVERVRANCGPEVAEQYAAVEWRDRDFAHDAIIESCIVYGTLFGEGK